LTLVFALRPLSVLTEHFLDTGNLGRAERLQGLCCCLKGQNEPWQFSSC
jgi:hypothetical protein